MLRCNRAVSELQAAQAQASQITAERLLVELEEARSLALSLGQAGAAVAASMGRAKSADCWLTTARM